MSSKTIEYYLGLPYKVEIYPEPDGSGYTAILPELPGCMTCAPTLPELWEMVDDIKRLWLEVALEDGDYIPEPDPVEVKEYSGRFVVRLPRGLHRQLAECAERESTSLNTIVVSTLAHGMGIWTSWKQETKTPKLVASEVAGWQLTQLWSADPNAPVITMSKEKPVSLRVLKIVSDASGTVHQETDVPGIDWTVREQGWAEGIIGTQYVVKRALQ